MSHWTVNRRIAAPVEKVFDTISEIEHFSKAIPHIVEVEMLSDVTSGVGTRFKETRLMGKRKASTVLEVTEYLKNERIRLVSDAGGTIWDSVFTVKPVEGQTELTLTMEARPHKFLARLMNPLIKGVLTKALEQDMDCVKEYCEEER